MKKHYFLIRILVLAIMAITVSVLVGLHMGGILDLAIDEGYAGFLVYIDLALALLMFLPELFMYVFFRKKYYTLFGELKKRGTWPTRIGEVAAILLSAAGMVLCMAALLTTNSPDMYILGLILFVYGGLYLIYDYLAIADKASF